MAVLCRRRAQMECLRREFEVQGIPYEIVGLGGLLDTPEVVDLVAALRVLADPGRSDALMRLLAGARWRIGTADLMAFRDWSQFLARRRSHGGSGDGGTADDASNADESPMETVVESDITDAASLVEALDFLPRPGWTSGHGRSLSPAALDRLGRLSAELRNLRGFIGDDLSTLIGEVERAMLLDIEVAAKPGTSIHQARRNLDAFHDAAAGFLQTSQRVDLLAFLGWLEAAASEEGGLDMADAEVNHEAVQLLTVHASKGLEWDVVFVPGLNAGAFPSNRDSRWSSGTAALPWPCVATGRTSLNGIWTSRTKRAGWTPKRTSNRKSSTTVRPKSGDSPTLPIPVQSSSCAHRAPRGMVPGQALRRRHLSLPSWPALPVGQEARPAGQRPLPFIPSP
ncbi:ATP-dependent DNA helicase PcrA [Arthrobacter sp. Hiyo8]|nr:ATP-dependent DNA helicase PcrA [Arthrobacter sp. Hiyo8]